MLPPGYGNLTVYQVTGQQQVWIGSGTAVTTGNGALVMVTPVSTETYSGSCGQMIYATTGSSTASTFCYILSSTG